MALTFDKTQKYPLKTTKTITKTWVKEKGSPFERQ
jgi:hypothetical protein